MSSIATKTPSSTRASARRPRTTSAQRWTPAAFLAPFLIPFILFYAVPILYALWRSLHKIERAGGIFGSTHEAFAGVDQFSRALTDSDFVTSVLRVLLFGAVQVPVMLLLALILALLLDSAVARAKRFFRMAFFVPYAIPGVIAALIWGILYSPSLSPLVRALGDTAPNFLGQNNVLWAIANVVTWTYAGYNMLIIYSALQAIPQELYEAAKLDGASNWTIAWRIKVPSVVPAIILTLVFSIIGTLQLFTEPTVFSQIATTVTSNYTPNMMVLRAAQNDYDYAAAISVILAVATFILSFAFLKGTQKVASE